MNLRIEDLKGQTACPRVIDSSTDKTDSSTDKTLGYLIPVFGISKDKIVLKNYSFRTIETLISWPVLSFVSREIRKLMRKAT